MGSTEIQVCYDNIIKSEEDNRLYRGLLLKNGMRVILVSDDDTDISAACMDINVGKLKIFHSIKPDKYV